MSVGSTGTTLGGRLTFGGLASGLDTNALVQTLLAVEARPLVRLESQKSELENDRKKYQELNTKLLELRNQARALDNRTPSLGLASFEEELLEYSAASADEAAVTVSATGEAVPGSYDIKVGQLASVGREFSTGFASQDTDLGFADGNTLSIEFGGDAPIEVDVDSGTTLLQIRDAINTDSENNGNVQASVLYDGTDYHLIIAGTETGAANDITTTASAGLGAFIESETVAQDAFIEVLGFTVQRESNELTDVLDGVTLNLRGTTGDGFDDTAPDFSSFSTVEVTIETDVTAIGDKLREFATAFNEVRDLIKTESAFDLETRQGRAFTGDSTVRVIDQEIQKTLVESFDVGGSFEGLAEIGVSFDSNGRLSVDDAKLEEALIEDVSSVKRLLGGDPDTPEGTDPTDDDEGDGVTGVSGVMTELANVLKPITQSGDGTLAIRDDSFEARIKTTEERIDAFELLLQGREEALIREFSALESSIAALQAQSGFLSAI